MTKTQELKNYSYYGSSHKGNVREENEDLFAHFETVNGTFFIVCDGMGGIKGGLEAAQITVNEIESFVAEEWYEDPIGLITESIIRANSRVQERFVENIQKPGSTLVLVLIRNNKVYYAHVGDSRVYYYTGKKLFQLTKDHSYVMQLVEKGIISEEDSKHHVRKHEITKAIGIYSFIDPSVSKQPISPADNDYILLCSDGLTNELSDKEISEILKERSKIKKKAKTLINKALDSGGADNISVQLVNFYNTGREKNVDFLSQNLKPKRRIKKRYAIPFTLLILVLIWIWLIKNGIFKKNETENESLVSVTKLLIYKNMNKDTLINIYFESDIDLSEEINKYNIDIKEIKFEKEPLYSNKYLKATVPVKSIYSFRTGKNIYSYPEFIKGNYIDLIKVNNKTDLFFSPGEIFIIPKEKRE